MDGKSFADSGFKLSELKGFVDIVYGPERAAFLESLFFLRPFAGHHYDFDILVYVFDAFQGLNTVHAAHFYIKQYQIGFFFYNVIYAFFAAGAGAYVDLALAEEIRGKLAYVTFIIDN